MLPLSDTVNVSINVGPVSKVRSTFDLNLIIGKSNVISENTRLKIFSSTDDMLIAGFTKDSPEYRAASIYFAQSPSPRRVAIGRWGFKKISESTETNEDATDPQIVSAFTDVFGDDDITDEETDPTLERESIIEAISACRSANTEWYACFICDASDNEILLAAKYIEGCSPKSSLFYNTKSESNRTGLESSIANILKNKNYQRTIGMYSTDDYSHVAAMAYCAAHSDTAYDLNNKSLKAIKTEDLLQGDVSILRGENLNYFVNRGSVYNVYEKGKCANGTFFDELMNLDMLENELQTAAMDTYVNNPKIPQTNPGVDTVTIALVPVLNKFVSKGFIAPGVWNAAPILDVNTGDILPTGYKIITDSVDDQSQSDRESRKSPDTYVLVKLAGSIQTASIGVYVNR
jgi:hypothetical protein